MISATSDTAASIFVAKSTCGKASAQKSKVVKKTSELRISNPNEQLINASIINESSIGLTYGSIYQVKSQVAGLLNDEGKVIKEIQIGSASEGKQSTLSKQSKKGGDNQDHYAVMGIEDEGNALVNNAIHANVRQLVPPSLQLALFHEDDDIESRLTSVSSKNVKITKSLSTVLGQALTADDTETLDWVLSNRDESVVTSTLANLKDHKLISNLFKQIIIKFQSQELSKQQGILLWLKSLISLHWVTIIKKADKDDLQSLGQIQSFIQKKTKSLDKVLLLKGKLEMLQKTMELKKLVAGQ